MISYNCTTWVVVTDTNSCKIFNYSPKQLKFIKEISHPENRLKDFDLISDRQGRYSHDSSSHGVYEAHSDPKDVKIDDFSREIAHDLEHGRVSNAYDRLIIISLPHMDGLLLQHISKHVKDLITHNIKNNVMHLNDSDLLQFINTHLL